MLDSTLLHFGIPNPPNPSKNRFQEALKNWSILGSIFNWFWLRFGGPVGTMLATFLGPRPPKRPPRPLQDASKTPPRRTKMPPKTLWIAQDGPRGLQTCPGALQTSILDDVWSILGPFLIDFWLIFDPFFIDFSLHFNVQKTSVSTSKNNTLMLWCSVTLLLTYLRSWRGGGDAALLRIGYIYQNEDLETWNQSNPSKNQLITVY